MNFKNTIGLQNIDPNDLPQYQTHLQVPISSDDEDQPEENTDLPTRMTASPLDISEMFLYLKQFIKEEGQVIVIKIYLGRTQRCKVNPNY